MTVRMGAVALAVAAAAALGAVFVWSLGTDSYNIWGAVAVVPIVIALNAMLIRHVSRRADEPWLAGLLALAFAAKCVGAMVRYYVAYVVYGGAADAQRYNLYAASRYVRWRDLDFRFELSAKQGTQYMELLTTGVYTVIGPSTIAAFVVFASLAFWGQYLLYRAFRTAVPGGDAKRYAVLLLLLPSMLYWPSSIGKESWLMLFLGVTCLGAARYFTRQPGAWTLLVTGAAGMALLRPHLAVLLFAALLVAQLFRPTDARSTDILTKTAGVAVLAAAGFVLTSLSAGFLGIDDFSWQAVSESVDTAGQQASDGGGSAFEATPVSSPLGFPGAAVTVLFRPFPWEALNIQMLVQALEGVLLLVLLVRAWPRLRHLLTVMRQTPYVTFAVVYTASFIWAFSGFGNFGILARQRVLMLPLFLVLLALPTVDVVRQEASRRRRANRARTLHDAGR
jgi:hypothetical protein